MTWPRAAPTPAAPPISQHIQRWGLSKAALTLPQQARHTAPVVITQCTYMTV